MVQPALYALQVRIEPLDVPDILFHERGHFLVGGAALEQVVQERSARDFVQGQ